MKFFLLALIFCSPALAKTEPAKTEKTEALWKEWYVYSMGGEMIGYYEETAEKRGKDKQLAITQRWTEKEGGLSETYIGSVVHDNAALGPVAFFSERKGSGQTYRIDGRAKGSELLMTFKPVQPKGKDIKAAADLAPNMVLSNFLPYWLAKKEPNKGPYTFLAVVEDPRDGKFDARDGKAQPQAVTKKVGKETCRKIEISLDGTPGEWWITSAGKLCEVLLPVSQARLLLSTENEAKKAFGTP